MRALRIVRLPKRRWPSLAPFLRARNGDGAALRCLHSHAGPDAAAYARELRALPAAEVIYVAALGANDSVAAVLGAEFDVALGRAWLRGPFVAARRSFMPLAATLLAALRAALPPRIIRLDAFVGDACTESIDFYRAQGFSADAGDDELFCAARPPQPPIPPGLQLRAPRLAWRAALAALHDAEFPAAYLTAARVLGRQPADRLTRVALLDGAPVGYVHVHFDPAWREGYVDFIAVAPAARGRGVARVLLWTAFDWTHRHRRARGVTLTVRADRAAARALYTSMGFARVRRGIGLRLDLPASSSVPRPA